MDYKGWINRINMRVRYVPILGCFAFTHYLLVKIDIWEISSNPRVILFFLTPEH